VNTITIAIESQPEVLVDERFGGVAVVIGNDRQWPQCFRLEAFQRPFAGLAMQALIGDFGQPLPRLTIDIVQIGELAQRPEVLAKIKEDALDFSFFPAAGRIAGMREEAVFTGEGEESRKEADETTVVLDNGGGQIVLGDLTCDPTKSRERMHVAASEGCKALAVGELDIQHPAVGVDEREGIQLARIAQVAQRTEVAPIGFESFSGRRLHSHEGAAG